MTYEPVKVFEDEWQEQKFDTFQKQIKFLKQKEELMVKNWNNNPDIFELEKVRFQIAVLISAFKKFKEAIQENVEYKEGFSKNIGKRFS